MIRIFPIKGTRHRLTSLSGDTLGGKTQHTTVDFGATSAAVFKRVLGCVVTVTWSKVVLRVSSVCIVCLQDDLHYQRERVSRWCSKRERSRKSDENVYLHTESGRGSALLVFLLLYQVYYATI